MKKNKRILIIVGVLAVVYFTVTIFFVFKNLTAHRNNDIYFAQYREKAAEYIQHSSDLPNKYENDIVIEFESTLSREEGYESSTTIKNAFANAFQRAFFKFNPKSIEEFNAHYEMIGFRFTIGKDRYEIIFEKDDFGEFYVSEIKKSEN